MKYISILIMVFVRIGVARDIFFQHDQQNQQKQIFKLFHDVSDGYYVDIGAYDPIFISNTIGLYAKGWNGLNIQAHPKRFSQFPAIKPYDVNINVAISDGQKYLKFYQFKYDVSRSSAKQDMLVNQKNNIKQQDLQLLQVPSMSMKQICYRYFKKTPNLLSLDVQGLGTIAINSNDWNNSLCKPEVMLIEKDTKQNQTLLHRQDMKKIGYTFHTEIGGNQIYIYTPLYDNYVEKYKKGAQILEKQKALVKWTNLLPQLYLKLNIPSVYPNRIQATTLTNSTHSFFYYYYPKQNSVFALQEINRLSNQFSPFKNRPILILLYNPKNTKFIVLSKEYKTEEYLVNSLRFEKISVQKDNGEKFQVHIFKSYEQEYPALQTFSITKNNDYSKILKKMQQQQQIHIKQQGRIKQLQQQYIKQLEQKLVKQKTINQQQQEIHQKQQARIKQLQDQYMKQLEQNLLKQKNTKVQQQQIHKKQQEHIKQLQQRYTKQLQKNIKQLQDQLKKQIETQNKKDQQLKNFSDNIITFVVINIFSVTLISVVVIKLKQRRDRKRQYQKAAWNEQNYFNQYQRIKNKQKNLKINVKHASGNIPTDENAQKTEKDLQNHD